MENSKKSGHFSFSPALKNLKLKKKPYKIADRDGTYVVIAPSGTVTFRLDYRLNGRRESDTLGQYGPADVLREPVCARCQRRWGMSIGQCACERLVSSSLRLN
jgi:hypothetical protein